MSNFAWMIILTLILTALGTLVLLLITLKYYWGARGTPPAPLKIMPHGRDGSATLPHSSPFMKLPARPAANPVGTHRRGDDNGAW